MSRRKNQNRKGSPPNHCFVDELPTSWELPDSQLNALYGSPDGLKLWGDDVRLLRRLIRHLGTEPCGDDRPPGYTGHYAKTLELFNEKVAEAIKDPQSKFFERMAKVKSAGLNPLPADPRAYFLLEAYHSMRCLRPPSWYPTFAEFLECCRALNFGELINDEIGETRIREICRDQLKMRFARKRKSPIKSKATGSVFLAKSA